MRRPVVIVVLLLTFPLFAATVPGVPRPDPFAAGMIPRAELERLPFPDRAQFGPTLPEPAAIVLHLPSTRFKSGEPIPAYFVVRNTTDQHLGLDMRLDLFSMYVRTVNSCTIDLRDLATGEHVRNRSADDSPRWSGVLRSEFVPVEFSKAAK